MNRPRPVITALAAAGLVFLAGCGASTPTNSEEPSAEAPNAEAPNAVSDEAFADSWLATAAKQFAKSQDPEPTFELSSETAVEFTFPSGSVEGTDARSDCQIAMIGIGEEYELTMTYPDGSVLCSDILG